MYIQYIYIYIYIVYKHGAPHSLEQREYTIRIEFRVNPAPSARPAVFSLRYSRPAPPLAVLESRQGEYESVDPPVVFTPPPSHGIGEQASRSRASTSLRYSYHPPWYWRAGALYAMAGRARGHPPPCGIHALPRGLGRVRVNPNTEPNLIRSTPCPSPHGIVEQAPSTPREGDEEGGDKGGGGEGGGGVRGGAARWSQGMTGREFAALDYDSQVKKRVNPIRPSSRNMHPMSR